jgi:DNA-binding NarL/FixJ family response regulator
VTGKVRILLADDQILFREALAERLNREIDFVIVGQVETSDAAVEAARRLRPDVILLDIDMPGTFAFEAARQIMDSVSETRLIFLSAFTNDIYIEQALAADAHGYLTKYEPPDRVARGIREVMNGGVSYSEAVQARIVVEEHRIRLNPPQPMSRMSTLSRRELEVLYYIAKGKGKKEIALLTNLSVKTVDHHTTRLMKKLDIHDRVDLARFAIREGLAEAQ